MVEFHTISDMIWTAARTKARCEKVVQRHCERHAITCYLPMRRRAKRYQRRTVETFLPMFPNYIFVQLRNEDKSILLQSHRLVSILSVTPAQERQLVEELRQIRALEQVATDAELVVKPEIVVGHIVRVVSGPFRDITGIVERRQGKSRITINVEMLGQSVTAEVDLGEVEPTQV